MVTVVWPLLDDCVGRLAFCHSVGSVPTPGATCKPPAPSPSGTLGSCSPGWFGSAPRLFGPDSAALRAAFCTAWIAWVARVSDCIDCCVAAAACCADVTAADAAALAALDIPPAPQLPIHRASAGI